MPLGLTTPGSARPLSHFGGAGVAVREVDLSIKPRSSARPAGAATGRSPEPVRNLG